MVTDIITPAAKNGVAIKMVTKQSNMINVQKW